MFNIVDQFEKTIAAFYGAPYAVATDSCTHAIELCLRLQNIRTTTCPARTYVSVPMTLKKLHVNWAWTDAEWIDWYQFGDTNIIDAAVLWQPNSYKPGKMMCLSFQYQKHLSLGRGGMILTDDEYAYKEYIKMSYDGRLRGTPWAEQDISSPGFHYYMTPETAQLGLDKFEKAKYTAPARWTFKNYPDLRNMTIFKNA